MQRIPRPPVLRPPLSRNRKSIEAQPKSDKLFGKYDELIRLVLGFILTAVVGGYLTRHYTIQQANLTEAAKIFNDHSKLIGDRYFAQNRLHSFLAQLDEERMPEDKAQLAVRIAAYQEAVKDWNSARGFNREMIKIYFGDSFWSKERDIHYMMRGWGNSIEGRLEKKGAIDYKCMKEKIDVFLVRVHDLRVTMAQALQQGKVGENRESGSQTRPDHPEYLCFQPVKP